MGIANGQRQQILKTSLQDWVYYDGGTEDRGYLGRNPLAKRVVLEHCMHKILVNCKWLCLILKKLIIRETVSEGHFELNVLGPQEEEKKEWEGGKGEKEKTKERRRGEGGEEERDSRP